MARAIGRDYARPSRATAAQAARRSVDTPRVTPGLPANTVRTATSRRTVVSIDELDHGFTFESVSNRTVRQVARDLRASSLAHPPTRLDQSRAPDELGIDPAIPGGPMTSVSDVSRRSTSSEPRYGDFVQDPDARATAAFI